MYLHRWYFRRHLVVENCNVARKGRLPLVFESSIVEGLSILEPYACHHSIAVCALLRLLQGLCGDNECLNQVRLAENLQIVTIRAFFFACDIHVQIVEHFIHIAVVVIV